MKKSLSKTPVPKRKYRYIPDSCGDIDCPRCSPCSPNDAAVSDREIYCGRISASFQGQYYKDSSESLNPLHRRGIDFTDVGNILASLDSQEESVNRSISRRRAEIEAENSASETSPK